MSSRTEVLRSRILDCGNPTSDPSLNQKAIRSIREGEGKLEKLKGKALRVARREARRMQELQNSEVQPPSLRDTIEPKIS